MAIRILLDHGVQQDHIVFIVFLVAKDGGISILRQVFPYVKIVCAAIDDRMREGYEDNGTADGEVRKIWAMQPGLGQMGESSCLQNYYSHLRGERISGDRYYL